MSDNDLKAFTTSMEKDDPSDKKAVKFTLDGRELTAHRPKDAAILLFTRDAESSNPGKRMHAAMQFLDACMIPADREHIANRLRDPDDKFDIEELIDIFQYVTSKVTGTPTESQPG